MKIAGRGGHTELCTGASALIDELTEDRKVTAAVLKYLRELGNEVLDVTPPVNYTSSLSADLAYGVNKANEWGADLFVSFHFNKAYSSYNGALGSEVCVYSTHEIARRVVDALGDLGFKNRGQKIRTGLYELKHTNMKSMIVETCFVEATEDVTLYKKLGVDLIGKKIAEAIANKKVPIQQQTTQQRKVEYEAHIQNIGWQGTKYDGQTAGTVGESKRLEALRINCPGIKFKGHVQNIGWTSERVSGEIIGTAGEDLRLEAVQILKDGIKYRVHIQNKGWTEWKNSGEIAGTVGESLRIEAIEIKLV
ncbi:N-acetylmuramoyl-L-alanine amidase [Clostridium sp. D53t1_180928_C8]|uniref:N-acetylmuramoyl-L-alanine amidase n=1 Tax=Clostridium sp. D53t1_180928_C8 TaxID=2787101 RepID=UPI0018AB1D31|nr:N-acetylmuramoyl-L-alanine amidase [Clostridium sp. D53t1_180928_C8]